MAWVPLKGYPRITQSKIIILTYPGIYKSGNLIPSYPGICKSRHLIPTYPGLSQSTKPILGYPGLSWLAQGVAFPDGAAVLPPGPRAAMAAGPGIWASGWHSDWQLELEATWSTNQPRQDSDESPLLRLLAWLGAVPWRVIQVVAVKLELANCPWLAP